jgi:hypothetical protein
MPSSTWKRLVYRTVWAIALVIVLPGNAKPERLPIKTYTTSEGLAQNSVNRIVRDSRGFLWFCTEGGLSRYDGYSFTNYGVEQGLPDSQVRDLLEGPSAASADLIPKAVRQPRIRGTLNRQRTSDDERPMIQCSSSTTRTITPGLGAGTRSWRITQAPFGVERDVDSTGSNPQMVIGLFVLSTLGFHTRLRMT